MGITIPQVVTEDRASGAQFIDGSLKFDGSNGTKSTRLEKTFTSVGNRTSWTWSCWVKRDILTLSNRQVIFGGYGANNDADWLEIGFDANGDDVYFTTSALAASGTPQRRDPAGWYHFFSTYDGSTLKIYVNNNLDLSHSFSGNRGINNNVAHFIGQTPIDTVDRHLDGRLTQCYFVDGQVLNPSDFAFTDLLTNTWRPKKYTGTFTGTNTFYLPMDGNSPIGQDKSGNGNDWTPVNFGGSNSIEKATGALPILNTVNGGRVATVGTRDDANASNLVLALPLVGNANDVSNRINSGSTTKSPSVTGATFESDQSNFYGGGLYFNGPTDGNSAATDYVTIADSNSEFVIGTGDFTMECWVWGNDWTGPNTNKDQVFMAHDGASGASNYIGFYIPAGVFSYYNGSANIPSSNKPTLNDQQWYHVAVSRESGTSRVFLDGVLVGSASDTNNIATGTIEFGRNPGNNLNQFNGYLQDFRLYVGTAKYTQNFIPASTNPDILPDTPSGVSGSSKLTKITDGAVSFRGSNSGDELNINDSSDFHLSNNDFTMECFIYQNAAASGGGSGIQGHWNIGGGPSDNGYLLWVSTDQKLSYVDSSDGTNATVNFQSQANAISLNRWHHVAATRSGSTFRLFVDGIQVATTTGSHTINDATTTYKIGAWASTSSNFPGFISNVRLVNGTALYTSDFTPPTEPLTNVTNTVLLCCQSTTSAFAAAVTPAAFTPRMGGYRFTTAKVYSTYSGGVRAANYSVQYSDDDANWTTAWSGNMSNNSSCGLQQGTGSGNPGAHRYWRYVENSTTNGHHPRISRIVLNDGTTDVNIKVYVADNCSDNGDYQIGTTSTYEDTTWTAGIDSDATATNFNPFTDDINTIRGQETGYATLNPLNVSPIVMGAARGTTLTDGNLTSTVVSGAENKECVANISATSGKYYYEVIFNQDAPSDGAGWVADDGLGVDNSTNGGFCMLARGNGGTIIGNGSSRTDESSGTHASFNVGDVIGCAIDLDSRIATWYKNGQKHSFVVGFSSRTNLNGLDFKPLLLNRSPGSIFANFGQKPFKFPPPDGFQPLNLSNVQPEKVIARPDQYVSATLFTGTGDAVSSRTVELPQDADLVWAKSRDRTSSNQIADTVRGNNSVLITNAQLRAQNPTTEFNGGGISTIDGKTITIASGTTNNQNLNVNGDRAVIWSWKAGGSKSTFNVDDVGYASAAAAGLDGGTITPTGASVGTKQGFSILMYQGNGTAGANISHGLSEAPKLMIHKSIDQSRNWYTITTVPDGNTRYAYMNTTKAITGSAVTAPTSSLMYFTSSAESNTSGENYIVYMWHDVPGLQKFGTYEGNTTEGAFVELGFRPAIIMLKSFDQTWYWNIHDSKRSPINPGQGNFLRPDQNYVEGTTSGDNNIDFLSNGFKIRSTTAQSEPTNVNGQTYFYAAWAEAPSINLYGAQANAR